MASDPVGAVRMTDDVAQLYLRAKAPSVMPTV